MAVKKTKKELKELYKKKNEYHKLNDKAINIRFNLVKDADILDLFSRLNNKAEYLRKLIRFDIENNVVDKNDLLDTLDD